MTSNSANVSGSHVDSDELSESVRWLFVVLGVVSWTNGVFGNIYVLTALTTRAVLRSPHNIFIGHLAVADLYVVGYGQVFWVWDVATGSHLTANVTHCVFNGYVGFSCCVAGILFLWTISCNRYISICHYSTYRKLRITKWRASWICGAVWVASFASSSIPFYGPSEYGYEKESRSCFLVRTNSDNFAYIAISVPITIIMLSLAYFNLAIFRFWRQSRRRIRQWKTAGPQATSNDTPRNTDDSNKGRPQMNNQSSPRTFDENAAQTSHKSDIRLDNTDGIAADSYGVRELEVPEIVTTNEVPEIVTTNEVPEIVTTNEVLEIVTTNEVPEIVTTNEVPEIVTTNEVPEIVTTNEVSEIVTTNEVLEIVTTNEVPEIVTPNEVPEIVTTNEVPEKVTTNEVPERVTTNEVPERVTTNEVPERVTTNEVPERVTTNEVPEIVTTNEVPERVTTNEVPERVTTNEVPEIVTTNEVPEIVTTNEVPEIVSTNEVPEIVTTNEVPEIVTTNKVPEIVTTDEVRENRQIVDEASSVEGASLSGSLPENDTPILNTLDASHLLKISVERTSASRLITESHVIRSVDDGHLKMMPAEGTSSASLLTETSTQETTRDTSKRGLAPQSRDLYDNTSTSRHIYAQSSQLSVPPSGRETTPVSMTAPSQSRHTAATSIKSVGRQPSPRSSASDRGLVRSLLAVYVCVIVFYGMSVGITALIALVELPPAVVLLANLMLFANSSVNWIIYAAFNQNFRLHCTCLKKTCCGKLRARRVGPTR